MGPVGGGNKRRRAASGEGEREAGGYGKGEGKRGGTRGEKKGRGVASGEGERGAGGYGKGEGKRGGTRGKKTCKSRQRVRLIHCQQAARPCKAASRPTAGCKALQGCKQAYSRLQAGLILDVVFFSFPHSARREALSVKSHRLWLNQQRACLCVCLPVLVYRCLCIALISRAILAPSVSIHCMRHHASYSTPVRLHLTDCRAHATSASALKGLSRSSSGVQTFKIRAYKVRTF